MKKATLFSIILFLLLVFIFGNSMLSADASNRFSFWTMGIVLRLFPGLGNIYWMTLHSIIRKCAHVIEYFALGIVSALVYLRWSKKSGKYIWLSAAATLLVAAIDETLQYFSPLRHMRLIDIVLDFLSSLLGIAVVYLIFCFRKKH